MAHRELKNNAKIDFKMCYYKKGLHGEPVLVCEEEVKKTQKTVELDPDIPVYWLTFKTKIKNGFTVKLTGGQILEFITVKPHSDHPGHSYTVVKINASESDPDDDDDDDNKEEEDILVDPPSEEP